MRRGLLVALVAMLLTIAVPLPAAAFSGFGSTTADGTYGGQLRFTVQLPGGPPEKLALLLRFAGSDGTVVIPVEPGPSSAEYVRDTSTQPITPNTSIAYRWRATVGDEVTLSPERTILYDDDRRGLDWHSARIGAATVHWYGGAESQARHFGSISADAAAAAETTLGHDLAGPIDIFVYDSREDFFGALGPGAREWTGAATYPELRTVFMWLGSGSSGYLEQTMTHEVTHVVFQDATANPFHQPAHWFNEGLAVWSERQTASGHEANVRSAASAGRLLAFEGIAESFPIGSEAARLAYDEGATMVQMIIDKYGRDSIAAIAAAWRAGDGDTEALEAGTGVTADRLYQDYFASFGAAPPMAIEPAPILPSDVDRPPQPAAPGDESAGPSASSSASPAPGPSEPGGDPGWIPAVVLAGLVVGIVAALLVARRRAAASP